MSEHSFAYHASIEWTGNQGTGTSGYRAYTRDYDITAPDKPVIQGSSEVAFRGDKTRYNPEDMLVASLAACHMLWYLHLAAEAGIVVETYTDDAEGTMVVETGGAGRFTSVTLRPRITLGPDSAAAAALALHETAHKMCFIANSVNFPVTCEPLISEAV